MPNNVHTTDHGETIASFIRFIESHPALPVAEVARFYEVTERAVRTYVQLACEELSGFARVVPENDGYVLRIEDPAAYAAWRRSVGGVLWNGVPSTPQGRVSFLVNDLLCRTDWVTLDSLARALFCSRRTVVNALDGVASYVEMFGLVLERRPHRGIRINGSEGKRRICLANIMLDRMASDGSLEVQKVEDEADSCHHAVVAHRDFGLSKIAACVDEATREHGFSINSVAYQNLLVHIAVAVVRVRAACYVSEEMVEARSLVSPAAWSVATSITERVSAAFHVELPQSEVAYIAIHLAGKRILLPAGNRVAAASPSTGGDGGARSASSALAHEDSDSVSDEAWSLAGRMVDAADGAFGLDLGRDLELHMNLARHLGPLMIRLTYRMRLENPLCADIRARYPFAFACALEAAAVLAGECEAEVSEDEVAYLALAFALALERRRLRAACPKNVLVVCASGMGSAELLAMRCREEFGDQLGSITTCDVSQVPAMDFSDIDYLFTTVPLPCEVPVPVREVGYFLDRRDVDGVRQLLSSRPVVSGVRKYICEELFVPHLSAASDVEAIIELADVCRRHECISPRFVDYVMRREQSASTAFGNGVAMPHPIISASDRTFVCAGLADRPIAWGSQRVEVVFLVSVSADANENLHDLYDALLSLASDAKALKRLLAERRFDSLLTLLERALASGAQSEKREGR